MMIGALKMASMRVPVYGFVSNVESHVRAELTEYPTEAPGLTAKVIPSSEGIYDAPHQKLLITRRSGRLQRVDEPHQRRSASGRPRSGHLRSGNGFCPGD